MAAIVEGQIFPTLQAFKQALRDWAINTNFTPHILDSDSHRVRAGCRSSPDCPFRIRANFSEKRGNAKVTTCDNVHNCVSISEHLVSQTIKRPEVGKLKFLIEAVPKLINVEEEVTVNIIQEAVEAKYGQKIPLRQAQKVKRALGAKPKGPCRECRQMGHSKRTCPQVNNSMTMTDADRIRPNESLDYENGGVRVDFSDEEQSRTDRRCSRCFQPGHSRTQCPEGADPLSLHNGVGPNYNARTPLTDYMNRQARDETSIDPNLRNGAQRPNPDISQMQRSHSSNVHHDQHEQPGTPQDARAEAARLMQQAARLMQEAAKLNFEAARLTASVANS